MRVVGNAFWETRLIVVVTAVLVVFGVIAVYGASSIVAVQAGRSGWEFAARQGIGALIGLVLLLVSARADYHFWERHAWLLLGMVSVMLLILVLPFTDAIVIQRNGARRWLGRAGLAFQPAELAKFAVVAWTAMLATKKRDRVREFKCGLLPFLVILAPLVAMILFEPSLSNSVMVCLLAGVVLFAAGARIGHFLLLSIAALVVLWREIATVQYQLDRWLAFIGRWFPFLNVNTDYAQTSWQIQQSLIGIGSGRVLGVGFGEGMQKLGYLPYAYSDFVFSTIGEEWGFVGVTGLLVLFATFVGVGLHIAGTAPDRFGKLLAIGLTSMIGITAVFHIGVTLDLLPTTGLPLPFISYGRSNLIVSLLATGVLLSIGQRRGPSRSRR